MKRFLHCLFICLVFGSSTIALAKANSAARKSLSSALSTSSNK